MGPSPAHPILNLNLKIAAPYPTAKLVYPNIITSITRRQLHDRGVVVACVFSP